MLVLSTDVRRGTIVHTLANSKQTYARGPQYVRYFLNTNWIIHVRMMQPLDH